MYFFYIGNLGDGCGNSKFSEVGNLSRWQPEKLVFISTYIFIILFLHIYENNCSHSLIAYHGPAILPNTSYVFWHIMLTTILRIGVTLIHTINKWRSQDSGAFWYFSPGTHLLSTADKEKRSWPQLSIASPRRPSQQMLFRKQRKLHSSVAVITTCTFWKCFHVKSQRPQGGTRSCCGCQALHLGLWLLLVTAVTPRKPQECFSSQAPHPGCWWD